MKLAAKLDRAIAERDKLTAAIADLESKRDALDVEADDYAKERRALDEYIAVRSASLRIVGDQIVQLDAKVAAEERAAAAARRAQGIKWVEAALPERVKIVAEIEAAVKGLPSLFAKLAAWRAKFIERYPRSDVELPFAYHIDDERVLTDVLAALHTIRIEDVQAISGLADNEARHHADLIADLQQNPAPKEDIAA
jgi:hypothetical protein